MKNLLVILCAILFTVACASQPKPRVTGDDSAITSTIIKAEHLSYRVKAEYPHSRASYTQGLQYVDGVMWEGTGEHGSSYLQKIDLVSGAVEHVATLPKEQFGEGITILNDTIYQLTWTSNKVHIYDMDGRRLKELDRSGEGWGLTTDGQVLYLSDGSDKIYKVNPETFRRESSVTVVMDGMPIDFINELEWIEGRLWANVYMTDYILIINPQNGVVEGVIDFRGLLPASERRDDTDVLNGIAYDSAQKRIFITGKRWPKIYEIEIQK